MSEEIKKLFIEAKKEIEMPKDELLEKLWDLQQRVHDAIEYIESNSSLKMGAYGIPVIKQNELLEILKGDE